MDDPAWTWPAWKFGLKRSDLFTTLHDQYNTFSYTLQDPEAFHHDVYEVSHMADTPQDFHRFMADRQRQRIAELHESLESLAVEIIANPKLMGSDQWQYALQLFRTKSFDSIVRYFASYLPDEYLDRCGNESVSSSRSSFSEADSVSTKASSASGACSPFLDDFFPDDDVPITDEPCSLDLDTNDDDGFSLPYATKDQCPRISDSPIYAPTVSCSTNPSPRSMSFSDSESNRASPGFVRRSMIDDDDETCQSDESDLTTASSCDSTDTPPLCESAVSETANGIERDLFFHAVYEEEGERLGNLNDVDVDDDDDFPTAQHPDDDELCTFPLDAFVPYDTPDSDTPTPTPKQCLPEHQPAAPSLPFSRPPFHRRSPSPRSYLAHHRAAKHHNDNHSHDIRRSPEEASSRVQKAVLPDFGRRAGRSSGKRSCLRSRSSSTSSRRLD